MESKTQEISISIASEELVLDGSGAAYWPDRGLLLLSDLHLGKVSHFRKFGAAIPRKALYGNFQKMDRLIEKYRPVGIYFLGDLFHSHLNAEWGLFRSFVQKWRVSIEGDWVLVIGNHDLISDWRFIDLGIQVVDRLVWEPFLLSHKPEDSAEHFNICGHIHPAIRVREYGRTRLRIPCFYKTRNRLILPAFGAFTGTHVVRPRPGEECYLIADGEVFAWRGQ